MDFSKLGGVGGIGNRDPTSCQVPLGTNKSTPFTTSGSCKLLDIESSSMAIEFFVLTQQWPSKIRFFSNPFTLKCTKHSF